MRLADGQAMASAPSAVENGGSLAWTGGDYIYAFRGGGTTDFWRYSISGNSWATMASWPSVSSGGSLAWDGGDNIFALCGGGTTGFWRYSISGNSWTNMAPVGAPSVSWGGSLAWTGGENIYGFSGGGTTSFWCYSIPYNFFTAMASAPSAVSCGGSLAWTGGNYIYAFRGSGTTDFWRYSISGNSWTAMASIPVAVDAGGSLEWTGGEYIYALSGAGIAAFWRYSISSDSWAAMEPTPVAVGAGGSLAWTGGDNIYAFCGGGTTGFWRYRLPGFYYESGTYISSSYDTGANDARITRVSWTVTGATLTMEVAAGNAPNPTNWESVTNGDTSIAVTGRYIRYRATFSGTGLSDDPELEDVTIDYAFPTTLTCSVDNLTPAPGQEIGISGYLRDLGGTGISGKTIHLFKNGFDTGLTTLTMADGYYGILTTASSTPRVDNYNTRFAGDAQYFFSESPAVQVTVTVPNEPPSLSNGSVSPTSGLAGTDFVFEVTYADADGDAPSHVSVYVDALEHAMSFVSGNYTAGALYRYTWSTTSADVGSHTHYFEASDNRGATARLPATGNYPGPTVTPAYKVFGWVKSGGTAIAGAQVKLDGRSTTTDENGYYEFTGLEGNKSYDIAVSAQGYGTCTGTTSVGAADVQSNIDLVKVAEAPILLIAVALAVVGCAVGGFVFFIKKRPRKRR